MIINFLFETLTVSPTPDNKTALNMISIFAGAAVDDINELMKKLDMSDTPRRKELMLWHIEKLTAISNAIYDALDKEGYYHDI